MNKKWVWYVCAVLLCCGSLAFVSIAKQSGNVNSAMLNSLAKQKAGLIQSGQQADYQAKLDLLTRNSVATSVVPATTEKSAVSGSLTAATGHVDEFASAKPSNDEFFAAIKAEAQQENLRLGRAENGRLDDCTTPFPEDVETSVGDPVTPPALPACWGQESVAALTVN